MQSDQTEGYHLFIEPTGSLRDTLQQSIVELAHTEGGPVFPPHVTVLRGIADDAEEVLVQKAAELAYACEPFELRTGEEGMEDAYFRALYLHIAESEELSSLHARAGELFSVADAGINVPHLSLLYGNYPEERKRAALAALPVPEGTTFLVDRISLYQTHGGVSDWKKIQEFPFGIR